MESNEVIEFTVPMAAVAKERPRVFRTRRGFVRSITPTKTRNFEIIFGKYAIRAMQGKKPIDRPLSITLAFWFKSPKKKKYSHPTKMDLDNLIKSVCDSLNKICWTDDRFIFKIVAGKYFSMNGEDSIAVKIETNP